MMGISIGRKSRKVKFTPNEYKAIKIMAEQQLASMKKHDKPDEQLKYIMGVLESVYKKVKHIIQ